MGLWGFGAVGLWDANASCSEFSHFPGIGCVFVGSVRSGVCYQKRGAMHVHLPNHGGAVATGHTPTPSHSRTTFRAGGGEGGGGKGGWVWEGGGWGLPRKGGGGQASYAAKKRGGGGRLHTLTNMA